MKKLLATAILSPDMHPDKVGERIEALREVLKITRSAFADRLEMDRSALTKVENGETGLSLPLASKIATYYGVGLDYIYRGVITDVPDNMRQDVVLKLHAIRTGKLLDPKASKRPKRPSTPQVH